MPRRAREWTPGTYHVYCRGNRKQNIFIHDDDLRKYLSYLLDTKQKYPFKLHAYCLMPNHLHLLLESDKVPLDKILHTQHTRYAIYFNKHMILSAIYSMGDLGLLMLIQLLILSALASISTSIRLKRELQTLRKPIHGAAVLLTLKNSIIP
jgi:REP element-mobilizing transposase RayT